VQLAIGQYISRKQCQFLSFKINIQGNSDLLNNKQIVNQFDVLVSFILGLAHPVDAS